MNTLKHRFDTERKEPTFLRRIQSYLGRIGVGQSERTVEHEFEHPQFVTLRLPQDIIDRVSAGNYDAISELVDTTVKEFTDGDVVYRGLNHPAGNATPQRVTTYGTDRFEGFEAMDRPRAHDVEDLVPYRNDGDRGQLTADTYAVPDAEWALQFAGLGSEESRASIVDGTSDAFLVAYDANELAVDRVPDGGGEQWRGTFKHEPRDAFVCLIQLKPDA